MAASDRPVLKNFLAMTELPSVLVSLVHLSVSVARNDWGGADVALRDLDSSSCEPVVVDEAILQLCLFVGYPATLTTAELWRGISGAEPTDLDTGRPSTLDAWNARGEELCREIYGTAYEQLRSNVAAIHPALDRWMIMEGYGKVLGRPGLDLGDRELCIIGVLAAGGWKQQLHSHLRGALRCGVPYEWVEQALEIGLEHAEPTLADELRELWANVRISNKGDSHVH